MRTDDRDSQLPWLDAILRKRETRHIFIFACLLAGLAVIQGAYGYWIDSLGLISDSLQKGFHCVALFISVIGMVASQRPATFAFSYGYDRAEVLAAFSNSLFLTFVCLFIVAGAASRVVETGPGALAALQSSRIFEFGVLGLALNVGGVLMLGAGASVHDAVTKFTNAMQETIGGGGGSGGGSANGPLLPVLAGGGGGSGVALSAVYANLASHAASSLTVIVSSLLITYEGWLWADTIASLLVAGFTLSLALPLLRTTGLMMLQVVPPGVAEGLARARREASIVDGVLGVSDEHVWAQSPGVTVGSLVVTIRSNADAARIRQRVGQLYSRFINDLTVQIDKDAGWSSSSSSSSGGAYYKSGSDASPLPSASSSADAAMLVVPMRGTAAPVSTPSTSFAPVSGGGGSSSHGGSAELQPPVHQQGRRLSGTGASSTGAADSRKLVVNVPSLVVPSGVPTGNTPTAAGSNSGGGSGAPLSARNRSGSGGGSGRGPLPIGPAAATALATASAKSGATPTHAFSVPPPSAGLSHGGGAFTPRSGGIALAVPAPPPAAPSAFSLAARGQAAAAVHDAVAHGTHSDSSGSAGSHGHSHGSSSSSHHHSSGGADSSDGHGGHSHSAHAHEGPDAHVAATATPAPLVHGGGNGGGGEHGHSHAAGHGHSHGEHGRNGSSSGHGHSHGGRPCSGH